MEYVQGGSSAEENPEGDAYLRANAFLSTPNKDLPLLPTILRDIFILPALSLLS